MLNSSKCLELVPKPVRRYETQPWKLPCQPQSHATPSPSCAKKNICSLKISLRIRTNGFRCYCNLKPVCTWCSKRCLMRKILYIVIRCYIIDYFSYKKSMLAVRVYFGKKQKQVWQVSRRWQVSRHLEEFTSECPVKNCTWEY